MLGTLERDPRLHRLLQYTNGLCKVYINLSNYDINHLRVWCC